MRKSHVALLILLAPWPALAQTNPAELDAAVAFAVGNWQECLEQTGRLYGRDRPRYYDNSGRSAALARASVCCAILGDHDPAVQDWCGKVQSADVGAAVFVERLAAVLAGRWDDVPKLLDAVGSTEGYWYQVRSSLADAVTRLEGLKGELAEQAVPAARIAREALVYLDAMALGYGWIHDETATAALAGIVAAPAEQRERAEGILRRAWITNQSSAARQNPYSNSAESFRNVAAQMMGGQRPPDSATTLLVLRVTDDPCLLRTALERGTDPGRQEVAAFALKRLLALAVQDPLLFHPGLYQALIPGPYAAFARAEFREDERLVPYPARREVRRLLFVALDENRSHGSAAWVEEEQAVRKLERAKAPESPDASLALADVYLWQATREYLSAERPATGQARAGERFFGPAAELFREVLAKATEPGVLEAAWVGLAEADPVAAWQRREVMTPSLGEQPAGRVAARLVGACGLAASDLPGARTILDGLAESDPDRLIAALAGATRVLGGDPVGATAVLDQRTDRAEALSLLIALASGQRQNLPGVPPALAAQALDAFSTADRAVPLARFAFEQLSSAVARAPDSQTLCRICMQALAGRTTEPISALRREFLNAFVDALRRRTDFPEAPLDVMRQCCPVSWETPNKRRYSDLHWLTLACLDLAKERGLSEDRVRMVLSGYLRSVDTSQMDPKLRAELVLEARSHYP